MLQDTAVQDTGRNSPNQNDIDAQRDENEEVEEEERRETGTVKFAVYKTYWKVKCTQNASFLVFFLQDGHMKFIKHLYEGCWILAVSHNPAQLARHAGWVDKKISLAVLAMTYNVYVTIITKSLQPLKPYM